jgi:hypothetical protein
MQYVLHYVVGFQTFSTTENKMNGNSLQGNVINTGEFKYSESPVWTDKFGVGTGGGKREMA